MDSDEVTMALLWSLYGVEWLLTSLSYTEKTLHIERFNTDLALQFFTIILKKALQLYTPTLYCTIRARKNLNTGTKSIDSQAFFLSLI